MAFFFNSQHVSVRDCTHVDTMAQTFSAIFVIASHLLHPAKEKMKYSKDQRAVMVFITNIFSKGPHIALILLSVLGLTLGFASNSSAQPALTSATYDATAGNLVVTGTNMTNGDTIAVNKFTISGEGGATYALTSANVTASSATTFSITLNAMDKAAVNQIINKNGGSANDSTPYNLAAADDWDANFTAGDTSDAINTVTASNVLISQTITFGANPGSRSFAGALALSVTATGGTSGNPIVFTSLTTGVCISVPGLAFINSVGTCVIAANQAGNATHRPAPEATQAIIITQGIQTITFGLNPGPVTFSSGGTFSVSANATGYTGVSTGPVMFTSTTTSICTVIGNTVTMVTKGSCIIAADQPGNANIDPAPQITQNITINGIPQAIMFDTPPNANVGDSGILFATGGLSGNPVIFTSITPTVCTMTDRTYTAIAGGGCIIAADQAGNAFYAAALRITRGIGVNGVPPVVTLSTVVSRKQHFGSNRDTVIDHTLPIGGNISTEPRAIGAGHQIVFQFSGPINQPGFPSAVDSGLFDIGSTSALVNPLANNEVIISLTGIPDNKRVKVTLTNVNNIAVPFAASIGFMLGDVNGTRNINSSDISAVKARSGQTTDASNYRFDINVSGTVNSSDISAVKARSGLTLSP